MFTLLHYAGGVTVKLLRFVELAKLRQ